MSDIFHSISVASNLFSIILALIGLFFVISNWQVWKKTSVDIIKAKAFLDKKFLERTWICLVFVGGIITLRRIYRYIELEFYPIIEAGVLETIFDILGFMAILLLVVMAYQWYNIIQTRA